MSEKLTVYIFPANAAYCPYFAAIAFDLFRHFFCNTIRFSDEKSIEKIRIIFRSWSTQPPVAVFIHFA
jgi:hypothetical protein